ncbi:MAG: tetratricopeptide repeat protein [Bacteroidetes bacterium]|nr:MAG: tetratricopeptide repeat protein [Bacteroidota bacterium]
MKKATNIFEHTDCLSEDILTKYISDKLSPAQKHEVEKHLLDCEMCSDAMEGRALIGDKNKISKITSELNQKIQTRISRPDSYRDSTKEEKKEVKIVFLQQYRSQLAIAASVVALLGLVLFFRSNMSMKEIDQKSSDKIFAEKFESPPADLSTVATEQMVEGKEQAQSDNNMPVAAKEPPEKVLADVHKAKEGARSGNDAVSGKSFGWTGNESVAEEDIPVQKARNQVLRTPLEEDNRRKNAEVPTENNLTITPLPEVKSRDEETGLVGKKDFAENRDELEPLKKNEKKAGVQAQSVAAVIVTGATSDNYQQEVTDKTIEVKSEKSGGEYREVKKGKSKKFSAGYDATKTTTTTPAPDAQTKITQSKTDAVMDSVPQFSSLITVGTTAKDEATILDNAMMKYDKQDYVGSLNDFEERLKQNPNDEKALFYSAVSYLNLGQTEKALTNLNKVLQNKTGDYYDSAQWYLSLAYLKNNDTKNARINLQELQNNSKSKYQKQANETLKEMQK